MKKKNTLTADSVVSNLLAHKKDVVQTFVKMQLFHTANTKWSKAEKQLALSLHYKSPAAYKFMLNTLKFSLPSLRTIQSWLKVFNLKTGLDKNFISKLTKRPNH